MSDRVLMIDLENVQKVDLSLVPADARVWVFYGVTQKKLPEELVVQAQPFGARLKWIKISGQALTRWTSTLRSTWGRNSRNAQHLNAQYFRATRGSILWCATCKPSDTYAGGFKY